jgi:hypothetical protein
VTANLAKWAPWIAVALAVAAFLPTLGFDFVSWDDPIHVYENPLVTGEGAAVWWHWLVTPALGYPSPVTVISYRLEWLIVGPAPWLYHATNLALHGGAVLLCYHLGRRIGLSAAGALIAALVFGLHPVVAEPVSWVTGRKDLLAGVLVLAATLECLNHPFSIRRPRTWVAAGLLLGATLSKPVALFAVVAWPLMVAMLPSQEPWSKRWKTALWSAVPAVVIAMAVVPVAFAGQEATGSLRHGGPLQLLREAWYGAGFHLGLVGMVRANCAKYLPLPWPAPFSPWIDLLPIALLALGSAMITAVKPARRRVAAVAATWALLSYLPSSGLAPLTRFLADVYLYLPMCGVGWFVGTIADEGLERISQPQRRTLAALLGAALIVALLLPRTLESSEHWENSVALWSQSFAHYPHDYRLCRNLGNAHNQAGQPERALDQYIRCRQIFGTSDFDKNIAITLFRLGQHQDALPLFRRLATERPDDAVIQKYLQTLTSPTTAPK